MIAWNTASKVAKGVIATFPKEDHAELAAMESNLAEFSGEALALVQSASNLRLSESNLAVRVTTRSQWVDANVASMSQLMDPVITKLAGSIPGPFVSLGAQAGAVQFGLLFGWMSKRVLGQYDAALFANSQNNNEIGSTPIYVVGSNITSLETRFGFPKSQFERWVLLHELTHKLQFEAVPWMLDYYRGLVTSLIDKMNIGPSDLFESLTRLVEDLKDGRNPLREAGLAGIFVSDEQRAILSRLGGLMSVLEGHGDLIMAKAATSVIPEAQRFEEVLHQKRESPNLVAKIVSQLYGFDAKLRQYEAGAKFLKKIEEQAGQDALTRLFEASDNMPDLDEIANPERWLSRVMALA